MKKISMSTVLFLTAVTSTGHAGEWTLFPVADQESQLKPAISVVAGRFGPQDAESASVIGLELSIECPLLQPPRHHIRQQVSITHVDDGGMHVSALELSPHQLFALSPRFEAGVGPTLGLSTVEFAGDDATEFTYGLGGSARYTITSNLFVGAEFRKVWMSEVKLGGESVNLGNTRAAVKIGFQF